MSIQESTRQMIIDELLMIGCVTGQMDTSLDKQTQLQICQYIVWFLWLQE